MNIYGKFQVLTISKEPFSSAVALNLAYSHSLGYAEPPAMIRAGLYKAARVFNAS